MNGDFNLNQLFYEITADDLYGMPVGVPNEIGAEGEVYDHVILTNMIKIGKCTMLGDFFDGPMERPLKVFPWQQGYDLFNEVEYQVPQDAFVPEVDFGILSAGLEPYTVTRTITNYNLEHNTDKWGFLKAKVTIAPVVIGPLEVRDEITSNGEHTIVKRANENGMSSVTFTVNVPQGGGQVQEMWYNIPNNANGTTAVIEPNQGYIGISRLNLTIRPLTLVPRNVTIEENGESIILPLEWQDGFSKVTINTDVPQVINRKVKVKYISVTRGFDNGSYVDLETYTFYKKMVTGDIRITPEHSLIVMKYVPISQDGSQFVIRGIANCNDTLSIIDEVEAGDYYVILQGRFNDGYLHIYDENQSTVILGKSIRGSDLLDNIYRVYPISLNDQEFFEIPTINYING